MHLLKMCTILGAYGLPLLFARFSTYSPVARKSLCPNKMALPEDLFNVSNGFSFALTAPSSNITFTNGGTATDVMTAIAAPTFTTMFPSMAAAMPAWPSIQRLGPRKLRRHQKRYSYTPIR